MAAQKKNEHSDVTAQKLAAEPSPEPSKRISSPQLPRKVLLPQPDQASGALVYEYSLTVPPGRNGVEPDLKLSYNNQVQDNSSLYGYGWSLNIPYIGRSNRKGTDQLYSQNLFDSALTGELVDLGSGNYGSKVDNGEFLKYSFANNTWTVKDKKGTQYTFGASPGARQDDPGNATRIYKWMLEEVRDSNNNYISYTYYKDGGQIYPSTIVYTGNGVTAGIFEVDFIRQSRSDVVKSYAPAFLETTKYLINEIDTKVSGTWACKYLLAYESGANGARSTLASITESGQDDSSVVTALPATTLAYQAQNAGWTANTNWAIPSGFVYGPSLSGPTQVADVNGDVLLDVLYSGKEWSSSGGGYIDASHVWLNNGAGFALNSSWSIPEPFMDMSWSDVGTRIADVNGDGLADILSTKYIYVTGAPGDPSYWNPVNKIYINNGSGWTLDTSWTLPIPLMAWTGFMADGGVRIFDVNGDGLPDILSAPWTGSTAVYLNTGTGWTQNTNWVMPARFMFNSFQPQGTDIADVNGDGLADVVFSGYEWSTGCNCYTPTSHVWINNGSGWTLDSSWIIPELFEDNTYNDVGTRLADVNGDGLVDILFSAPEWDTGTNSYQWHNRVNINNGSGWTLDTSWTIPDQFILCQGVCFKDKGVRIADIDGDGLPDILHADYSGTPVTFINNGHKVDSLTQITNNKGGASTVAYKPSTQYMSGGTLLNPKLPLILETVSQVSNNDGLGNSVTASYIYAGGSYYFDSSVPNNRKFANFGTITKADAAGNTAKTHFHQGNALDSAHGEYSDEYWKIGKPYRVEMANSSGSIYAKTINKWDSYDLGSGRKFVKLAQTVYSTSDGDTSPRDTAESNTYDDTNGNVTQETQWGEVAGHDDGSFDDIGNDKFTTVYSYATAASGGLSKFASALTTDQSGVKVKESCYYYDNLALGQISLGNLTKQEDWQSGTTYVNSQKTYNSYGLVNTDTDPRGKTTHYGYDSSNLYPTTITNPLNQATHLTYDYASGQVIQKIDPNSRVVQFKYDGLGRLLETDQPDLTTPSTLVPKSVFTYTDTSQAVSVKRSDYLDDRNIVDSYTYFDGLGRKIQERKEAEGVNFSVKDYAYNSRGLLDKESLPYFSTGSGKTSPTGTVTLYTAYVYDPLLRVTATTNAVGTTTNTYSGWKLTVTDPKGKAKNLYKDAYGNLVQIGEHNGASTYTTTYQYNYLGNLMKITDALSNIRNFTYDGLGRRLTAQDLHAAADATFGTWSYAYDAAGNMTQRIDPNGKIVNYTYDEMNRQLTEDYTGHDGTEVTYTYDEDQDGIGHLTTITSPGFTQNNSFNLLGQVAVEAKTIGLDGYNTSYRYDRQGNITLITEPDRSAVQYVYNSAGLVEKVQYKQVMQTHYGDIVANLDYSPLWQPTTIAYANGVTTTNTYDGAEIYRLRNKVSIKGVTQLQHIIYTYDPLGNITQLADTSDTGSAKIVTYTYDDLSRLISATAISLTEGEDGYEEAYSYDAISNLTEKNGVRYSYAGNIGNNYANPHAVTSIGNTVLSYDRNGNLLASGADYGYTWDYNNHLIQVGVNLGSNIGFAYDPQGQRIFQTGGAISIVYPSKYYNVDGNGIYSKHLFVGDTSIATIQATGEVAQVGDPVPEATHYAQTDHLTGSSVVTDSSGALEELTDYYPYGKTRIDEQSGSYYEQRKFTGHEYDSDSSLSYMGARYYNGKVGRFLSQDPLFLDIGGDTNTYGRKLIDILLDPQGMNSYSYAGNNPLKYVDPTGEDYYHFNNGKTEQRGDGTQNYYEQNDINTLNDNAHLMESNRYNLTLFAYQVRPGGDWDYKTQHRFFFYGGQLVKSDVFGNINYGYAGTAGGFGDALLHDAGGFVQVLASRNDRWGKAQDNYERPEDIKDTNRGVQDYRNSHPGSDSFTKPNDNLYKATTGQILFRGATDVVAKVKEGYNAVRNWIKNR
jgi:RHS repeat-associated protein